MKYLQVELRGHDIVVLNQEPIYLDADENLDITIVNPPEGYELYYLVKNVKKPINGNVFTISVREFKESVYLRLLAVKPDGMGSSIYVLSNFPMHHMRVIGTPIPNKYPDVIQLFNQDILDLKKFMVSMYEQLEQMSIRIDDAISKGELE